MRADAAAMGSNGRSGRPASAVRSADECVSDWSGGVNLVNGHNQASAALTGYRVPFGCSRRSVLSDAATRIRYVAASPAAACAADDGCTSGQHASICAACGRCGTKDMTMAFGNGLPMRSPLPPRQTGGYAGGGRGSGDWKSGSDRRRATLASSTRGFVDEFPMRACPARGHGSPGFRCSPASADIAELAGRPGPFCRYHCHRVRRCSDQRQLD